MVPTEIIQYQYNFLSLSKTWIEVGLLFCLVLSDFRKSFAFLEGYHISMLIQNKDIDKIYGFLLKQQLINNF
jgi:hypothetical protein